MKYGVLVLLAAVLWPREPSPIKTLPAGCVALCLLLTGCGNIDNNMDVPSVWAQITASNPVSCS